MPKSKKTGVLWDAYLVKPKANISSHTLLFLSKVLQKTIKEEYSYDNKAIWDKVKKISFCCLKMKMDNLIGYLWIRL